METALLVGSLLLKYGPDLAKEFMLLVQKKDPTADDWQKVFDLAKEPWVDAKPDEIAPPGLTVTPNT